MILVTFYLKSNLLLQAICSTEIKANTIGFSNSLYFQNLKSAIERLFI